MSGQPKPSGEGSSEPRVTSTPRLLAQARGAGRRRRTRRARPCRRGAPSVRRARPGSSGGPRAAAWGGEVVDERGGHDDRRQRVPVLTHGRPGRGRGDGR
nr:hypothetical protein [Angustibacter aerolatus]